MNRGAPIKRKTPLPRSTKPIPRYTRIKAKRSTPRRGEPSGAEKAEKKLLAYDRANGMCELCLAPNWRPLDGDLFTRAHLVHLHGRRRFGWGMDNLCIGCYRCHIELAHQGKIKLPATYGELAEWRKEHAGKL